MFFQDGGRYQIDVRDRHGENQSECGSARASLSPHGRHVMSYQNDTNQNVSAPVSTRLRAGVRLELIFKYVC